LTPLDTPALLRKTLNRPGVITNGDTWADVGGSDEYANTSQTGLHYVQLDLGALYTVDKVKVWHYAADGRTYHATKTQVSENGSTWTTVFDSAVSGEYAETAAGKTHSFSARNARYVRDYLNGSTSNAGDHWVEIEVWGARTTAYVGVHYERDGASGVATSAYYAGSTRVATRRGSVLYYVLSDHLGSTALTADSNGNRVSELRYRAFGETRYSGGSGTPTDRRFTGQQQEAALGLYFYNARYYDVSLGRFMQAATIVPELEVVFTNDSGSRDLYVN